MFKMYNREVKEYNKIVHEYQQKVRADVCIIVFYFLLLLFAIYCSSELSFYRIEFCFSFFGRGLSVILF